MTGARAEFMSMTMRADNAQRKLIATLFIVFLPLMLALVVASKVTGKTARSHGSTQEQYPPVPSDATRIYYVNAQNKLVPLPFESGRTQFNVYAVAKDDRAAGVQLKGSRAETILPNNEPRFYVFVADRMDPPPHLLVRLESGKATRRFTITVSKGRKGYAPLAEANVRLDYRILDRLRVEAGKGRVLFINYMEIRPRQPLTSGEYAIIGDDLSDIATFRLP